MNTRSDRRTAVAVIGGGASGTIVAAQLARCGVRSIVVEGSGRAGRGVAYSTTEPAHVLNVRAESMSAWAGEPNHFAERFALDGGDRRGFAQRRLFGHYLRQILDDALASGRTELVEASAVSAQRNGDGWTVELDDGSSIRADALVLAIGNQQPAMLAAFSGAGRHFVSNPWGDESQAAVKELAATGGSALLVGTGLTMVDLALSLDAAGYNGKMVAVSRRGLIPRSHADFDPAPVERGDLPHGSVRALSRWLRQRGASTGWRAAVDSLRPHSHGIWQSLDGNEQRRFLRHARPWWDVHRHRIAPEVGQALTRLIADGRLEVLAARITDVRTSDGGLEVDIRRRGKADIETFDAAFAFNCTGPLHAISRSKDPLLRSLMGSGEVRADQLDIGLAVDDRCRGGARLWAMGPLTKARYWEITAVPDIREQAAAVAEDIERELS